MYDCLKLENQLCFPLYLCSKELTRKYSKFLSEFDLTYTQYIVMLYLWEKESCNVSELGKTILLDSSTLTPLLKKLEVKGYIKRERSSSDERNLNISLTDEGSKLKDMAIDVPREMGKCINLDESEAKELGRILYKILTSLEKE